MRFLIDFSYCGANFNGYQKQPGKRTVQNEIEKVLTSLNGNKKVIIYSAGRTDAKVNALHQMAHFDLEKDIIPYKIKSALNSYLPDDIYINDVKKVDLSFHARYMSKAKIYEYKINTSVYNPLMRTYVYQYCNNLKVEDMKNALSYFIGTHDFTTFTSAEDKRSDKIRTIFDASITVENGLIIISFKGNGFLKYQVRNMVGLLIKVGEGKLNSDVVLSLIEKKDRKSPFNCAPACGLTLKSVIY